MKSKKRSYNQKCFDCYEVTLEQVLYAFEKKICPHCFEVVIIKLKYIVNNSNRLRAILDALK